MLDKLPASILDLVSSYIDLRDLLNLRLVFKAFQTRINWQGKILACLNRASEDDRQNFARRLKSYSCSDLVLMYVECFAFRYSVFLPVFSEHILIAGVDNMAHFRKLTEANGDQVLAITGASDISIVATVHLNTAGVYVATWEMRCNNTDLADPVRMFVSTLPSPVEETRYFNTVFIESRFWRSCPQNVWIESRPMSFQVDRPMTVSVQFVAHAGRTMNRGLYIKSLKVRHKPLRLQ